MGDDDSLVFVTSQGKMKRTALSDFKSAQRSAGLTAIKLSPGDRLQWVERTKPTDSVVVGNSAGFIIHFDLDGNLRNTGRAAMVLSQPSPPESARPCHRTAEACVLSD